MGECVAWSPRRSLHTSISSSSDWQASLEDAKSTQDREGATRVSTSEFATKIIENIG
jgi:hypothetical protein